MSEFYIYVRGSQYQSSLVLSREEVIRKVLNNKYRTTFYTAFSILENKKPLYSDYIISGFSSSDEAKWLRSYLKLTEYTWNTMSVQGMYNKTRQYVEKHKDNYIEYLV